MSFQDKQYISPTGSDFTEWVNTQEDVDLFEKMCEHEKKTIGVPMIKCIEDVVEAVNIGRQLQGKKSRVKYIGMQRPDMN